VIFIYKWLEGIGKLSGDNIAQKKTKEVCWGGEESLGFYLRKQEGSARERGFSN
jgi:hypothetical protein